MVQLHYSIVGAAINLLLLSPASAAVIEPRNSTLDNGPSIWDYSPDFWNDTFKAYPPLVDTSGKRLDPATLQGTRLFGWTRCNSSQVKMIREAWKDRRTLVKDDKIHKDLDWDGKAAVDFLGPSGKIPKARRKQIQHLYSAAEQMLSYPWDQEPWKLWSKLFLEVSCAGEDGTAGSDTQCARGKGSEDGGVKHHAYTMNPNKDNGLTYSKVTFCNSFFNLRSMSEAKDYAMSSKAVKTNLEYWMNRAHVFLHETFWLQNFMDTPKEAPYVRVLTLKESNSTTVVPTYGPYWCRVLRNWNTDPGYYTSQNADTLAWYATAIWVQKQIKRYPNLPKVGSKRPDEAPGGEDGQSLKSDSLGNGTDPDDPKLADLPELYLSDQQSPDFQLPCCPAPFSVADEQTRTPNSPECRDDDPSEIPYNVFSGKDGSVFEEFCDGIDTTKESEATVDTFGKLVKRTPPADRDHWKDYSFELKFKPTEDGGDCMKSCTEAFESMRNHCGRKGNQLNQMSNSTSFDVRCGTYSYNITAPPPLPPDAPELQERHCFKSDEFGKHGDIHHKKQAEYAKMACRKPETDEDSEKTEEDAHQPFIITYDKKYTYEVKIADDCETNSNDTGTTCEQLMIDNFRECDNGGAGGSIQGRCSVYEFRAQNPSDDVLPA